MVTNPKAVSVEETEGVAKGRTRSPAYPFINLETAIKRAQEFYNHQIRNSASRVVAVKHWGYQEKSSGGLQTIAALIAFGLLQDEDIGEKRKVKLTPNALRLLLDKRPDSPERAQLIKEMALTPKIHRDLWDRWGSSLPEEQVRYTLTAEWEPPFNEKTVDGFIREYKDTISFAKLTESDKVATEDGNSDSLDAASYVPKVGDYVQWESQGQLQFSEPVRVLSISSDRTHAFVAETTTGLPVEQLTRAKAPLKVMDQPQRHVQLLPQTQMKEDVYSIDEGRVVVQWPSNLSAKSFKIVKEYLKILELKLADSITQNAQQDAPK